MKQLIWLLPDFIHSFICAYTGYWLVKISDFDNGHTEYVWTNKPIEDHPFDRKLPTRKMDRI